MKRIRTRTALAASIFAALGFAVVAHAVSTPINSVVLEAAGGDAKFDAYYAEDGCFDYGSFYSPVSDGSAYGKNDAFDGGLLLLIEGRPFRSAGPNGNLVGQQLTVGPRKLAGVQVTRIDRALPNSPTLRSLVRLRNTTNKRIARSATIHTDLGSDSDTMIEASSSGDKVLSRADRWIVTSDEAPPDDPPVTHVLRGKGKTPARMTSAYGAFRFNDDGSECVFANFNFTLKPKQTRYLLFYVDMSESIPAAINGTKKYNRKRLNNPLKAGLSTKLQRNVLNWDLVD